MPLIKSKSKQAIAKNIATEMHAGKPQKQAIAIAYNVKPKAKGGILSTNARKHIAAKNFAGPDKSYPINDAAHARNALARVSQHGSPELKAKVRAKVANKFPGIEQSKAEGGSIMSDSNMMNALMKRRKAKAYAEGGRTEPDSDFNTDPDLRKQSSELSNGSRFDDILSDEQDRDDSIDGNEALYAEGGVAYNANLKENYPEDESQSHDEDTAAYDDGGLAVESDPSQSQSAQDSMRKAFNYPKKARGGVVSPDEDSTNIPAKSDGEEDPMNPLKKSGKAYQPKAIGNQGRPTIDLNEHRYAKGGMAPKPKFHESQIAYDEGVNQPVSDEEELLSDENSSTAYASGGNVGKNQVAYNSQIPYKPQLDTAEDHDEASSIAYADGGEAGNEIGDDRESIDSGHDVDSERHLDADAKDTPESKDEASSIAMSEGGNLIDLEGREEADSDDESAEQHLSPDLEDTYHESFDEHSTYAGGGQIDNDQSPDRNPKSFQNEAEQEAAIKARRRKHMISALND